MVKTLSVYVRMLNDPERGALETDRRWIAFWSTNLAASDFENIDIHILADTHICGLGDSDMEAVHELAFNTAASEYHKAVAAVGDIGRFVTRVEKERRND